MPNTSKHVAGARKHTGVFKESVSSSMIDRSLKISPAPIPVNMGITPFSTFIMKD